MRKIIVLFAVVFVSNLVFRDISFAVEKSVSEIKAMEVSELIELLNNPDRKEQIKAIDGLSKFREKDEKGFPRKFKEFEGKEQISTALIRLLERENLRKEKWWGKWEEEYKKTGKELIPGWYPEGWEKPGESGGEYYIEILDTVINLKDERAIPAIVGGVECGYPAVVVAEFGELAVPHLLERLEKTKNDSAKSAIIGVLGDIIKKAQITPSAVKGTPTTKAPFRSPTVSQIGSITTAFIKSLNDPNPFARMEAIQGLGILEDTSAISLLKPIAKNDSYVENTVSGDPSKFQYPVREEAQRVIKLLEEKKKEEKSRKKKEEQK